MFCKLKYNTRCGSEILFIFCFLSKEQQVQLKKTSTAITQENQPEYELVNVEAKSTQQPYLYSTGLKFTFKMHGLTYAA